MCVCVYVCMCVCVCVCAVIILAVFMITVQTEGCSSVLLRLLYSLPMHSRSDVEERDLGPPMTPFYTAATQTLLPL